MVKYSLEFKMKVVAEYLSGTIGLNRLAKKYHIKTSTQIRKWINAYKTLGVEGLTGSRKNKAYSVDFKLKAITMYEASEKSYQNLANDLGLNNPSLLVRWRQEYHKEGLQGLSRRQERPPVSKKEQAKKTKQTSPEPLQFTDLELANK